MPMRNLAGSLALLLILTAAAEARMYQWQSPTTGRAQLSGAAPAWYRSMTRGPRVLVFENGQLIDDTAVAVSEPRRLALRAAAFGDSSAAAPDAPATSASAALGASPGQATASEAELDSAIPAAGGSVPAPDAAEPAVPPSAPRAGDADKAAQLKAMIDAWDEHQLDQARSLLQLLPGTDAAAPVDTINPPPPR